MEGEVFMEEIKVEYQMERDTRCSNVCSVIHGKVSRPNAERLMSLL